MTTLHQIYLEEIKQERGKFLSKPSSIFTEEDIAGLPRVVQRYFRDCGYIGKEKSLYTRIRWAEAEMRLSPGGKWRRMNCYQFNAVPEPVRIVHMKMRIGGVIPLEARDKYQGGHGNMLVRILSFLSLQDLRGKEMDESALVTILSESLLIPAYALQPYIRWSAADENRAFAELRWNGMMVSGLFCFNERGEFVQFETLSRSRAEKGGFLQRVPWRIVVRDYVENKGIRRPSRAAAAWQESGNYQEYFRGRIDAIERAGFA